MFHFFGFLLMLALVLLAKGVTAGVYVGMAAFALLVGWSGWQLWQVLTHKPLP